MNIAAGNRTSRRRFLATVQATALVAGSGCLGLRSGENDGPAEFTIIARNTDDDVRDLSIHVRDEDADVGLLERRYSLGPSESHTLDIKAKSERARVSISAETTADSDSIQQEVRRGGSTDFWVEIGNDNTVSIAVGME